MADRGFHRGGSSSAIRALSRSAPGSLGPICNPLGIDGLTGVYKAVFFTMVPLLYVAAGLSLFVRLRRFVGIERQHLRWFAYAAAAFVIGIILVNMITAVDTPIWFERAGTAFFKAAGAAYPIAIGIAILRYRLYDIDLLIDRTLTASLALVYLGSVTATQAVFQTLASNRELPQLAIVVSTLVIAALFSPMRRRIQGFIDRRFYREKYDATKTLAAFNARLREETDLDTLADDVISVTRETMQPAHVALWLCPDPEPGIRSAATSEKPG